MARKISKKLNKSQKRLLLGLLIGDGTITNHPDFKITHSGPQEEFLRWKISLVENEGLQHGGFKEYSQKVGYVVGSRVIYVRLKTNQTIKAIRRCIYKPKKTIMREWLNWFTAREIAIWYMDDGHINVNTSEQRSSIQHTIKIATCVELKIAEMITNYFKEKWNIKFRVFPEGKETYSIATSSETDCLNFVKIVKPYIEQVPSLLYKIRDNFTKEEFIAYQQTDNFRSARHVIGD